MTRSQGAKPALLPLVALWDAFTGTVLRGCPGDSVTRDRAGSVVPQIVQHAIRRVAKHGPQQIPCSEFAEGLVELTASEITQAHRAPAVVITDTAFNDIKREL